MNRREFLRRTATGGAAAWLSAAAGGCTTGSPGVGAAARIKSFELEERTVAELLHGMASGWFTAASLTKAYLRRIEEVDRTGPRLKSVIEINPEALAIAEALDLERRTRRPRGPLHGIPILIKDNIDTHDRMTTTAGSLALEGSLAPRDAFVVERLRAAGAVILGKTNLSEWANFRGSRSISGWSGRGGQTRNPYVIDRSPSGSSSGSAAAVSANLCAVSVGTETNGSIVSPASYCGVVGIKPTVGLVSRSGIIPISASQDTSGSMGRTVADAAVLLGAMAGVDLNDAATRDASSHAESDYTRFLDAKALRGARIGMARSLFKLHRQVDSVMESALDVIKREGATLTELAKLTSRQDLGGADYQVMLYEFKVGLNAYFGSLGPAARVKSMEELIAFNDQNRERELPFFGQETLIEAQGKGPLTDKGYLESKERCTKWSQTLTALFDEHQLDAIVAPTGGPAHTLDLLNGDRGLGGTSTYAAVAGLPNITVPCGHVSGLPVAMSFFGRAWSEPRLIAIAYAFEQATRARKPPQFQPTLTLA
jgi:amidase